MVTFRRETFFEVLDLSCYLLDYWMNSRRTPYWRVQNKHSNPTLGLIVNLHVFHSLRCFVLPNTLYREAEAQPLRVILSEKGSIQMLSACVYIRYRKKHWMKLRVAKTPSAWTYCVAGYRRWSHSSSLINIYDRTNQIFESIFIPEDNYNHMEKTLNFGTTSKSWGSRVDNPLTRSPMIPC